MKKSVLRTIFASGLAAPAAALANGGDTFATATVLPFGPLAFNDTGTTVGFASDINSLLAGVSTYTTVAGPDVFYRIDILTAGTVIFTLTPTTGTYDPAIYFTNSALATNNPGLGPNSGSDTGLAVDPETVTLTLGPGTYFLAIDSFYSTAAGSGAFNISVTGTAILGVPEPSSVALLAVGLAVGGGALWRRRRTGATAR